MAKDKDNNYRSDKEEKKPYRNMAARRGVLFTGFALTILSLVVVAAGAICLFVPSVRFDVDHPIDLLIALFAAGVAIGFVAVIFAVAGANTNKPIARLSFSIGLIAFILGAGMLTVAVLIKLIIPLPGLEYCAGLR